MTEPAGDAPTPRTWWIAAGVLAGAWIVYLILWGPRGPGAGSLPRPALNPPSPALRADFHWTLRDLDGAAVPFAKFEGKAVFLNVWATWCPPCVQELPSIGRLAANPRLKDVAFVCVSVDQSPTAVEKFLRSRKLPATVLRATALPEVFMTDGIPATFLIAPDGRIAASEVGAAGWDDPAVVDLLERLARESKPQETTAAAVKP